MAYFETLTAVSVTLCFAFPYLMDKIMRPKYEEHFEELIKRNRDSFVEELDNAVNILKREKDVFNPETGKKMDDLFDEWGQIKSDETKLNCLIRNRMYLFFGWAVSIIMNLLAIDNGNIMLNDKISYGNFCTLFFGVMFLFSMIFSYGLFKLDDEISQVRDKTQMEIIPAKPSPISISSTMALYRELESEFEKLLRAITSFEKDVRFEDDTGNVIEVDFVIPSKSNPKYIVELKRSIRFSMSLDRGIIYRYFKRTYGSKTILIGDLSRLRAVSRSQLLDVWDYILDSRNLEEITKIFELES